MLRRLSGQMVVLLAIVNGLFTLIVGAAHATGKEPVRIVVLGDSLSAGYGVPAGKSFPDQLAARLQAAGHAVEIINAGVSGDTTSGGLARLDWSVPGGTHAVILELGANDMLRGGPPSLARSNLETIVMRLKARGIEVLIAGMHAQRSLGDDYVKAFDSIYPDLAAKYDAVLYPFFLDGVALDPKLNLPDGLHPTAEGLGIITDRILKSVETLIGRVRAKP